MWAILLGTLEVLVTSALRYQQSRAARQHKQPQERFGPKVVSKLVRNQLPMQYKRLDNYPYDSEARLRYLILQLYSIYRNRILAILAAPNSALRHLQGKGDLQSPVGHPRRGQSFGARSFGLRL